MNSVRCFSVVLGVLLCAVPLQMSYAQFNAQNAASDQKPAVKARPSAKEVSDEITGVIGDPGQLSPGQPEGATINGSKKVKFYMASWCSYCKRMEKFLNESKIPYDKFDVEKDLEGRKAYQKLMARGVPVLVVDRTVIRGYDPAATKAAWDQWNKKS